MRYVAKATAARKPDNSPFPFKSVGIVPIGNGAHLDVQLIRTAEGAQVLSLRNAVRSRAGMLPAGHGALVGLDRVPDLVALLQRAIKPLAVAS